MDAEPNSNGISRFALAIFANQWRSVSMSAIGAALFVVGAGIPGALGHIIANGGWLLLAVGFIGLAYQGIVYIRTRR